MNTFVTTGNDQDDRFLIEMIVMTEVESLQSTEDEEFEFILCTFAAGYQHITGISARSQLSDKEETARFSLKIEESCARNSLHVKSRLGFHGASKTVIETFAPLPDEDSLPPDESWKSLPAILPADTETIPVGDAKTLQAELAEADPSNVNFLSNIAVGKIQQKEQWKRDDHRKDEGHEWKRKLERFHRYLEQLRQVEVELVEEHDSRVMSTMSEETRQWYKQWPVHKAELQERARLVLEELSIFRCICMSCIEGLMFGTSIERFETRRDELKEMRNSRIYHQLQSLSFSALAGSYFSRWSQHTVRNRMLVNGGRRVAILARNQWATLLRRYITKWNYDPERKRNSCQVELLLEEHEIQHAYLTVSEGEERDRNSIAVDQSFSISQLAEQYFLEKEAAARVWQRRLAVELIERSNRRHMLRRLVTWYKLWKQESMIRKSRWLMGSVYGGTMKAYYSTWQLFNVKRNRHRHDRWQLVTDAKTEKQRLLVENSEDLGRQIIRADEFMYAKSLATFNSQHFIGAQQRHNERILATLCQESDEVQRKYRYHLWLSFVQISKAQKLAARFICNNEDGLQRVYLQKWLKWSEKRSRRDLELLELHSDIGNAITLEWQEAHARTVILQREDWSRVRRDFRVTNMLGTESRMELATALSSFNEKMSSAVLEQRWHTWTKFLRHRRFIRQATLVVEHMEYECELQTMAYYFGAFQEQIKAKQQTKRTEAAAVVFAEGVSSLEDDVVTQHSMVEEEEQWGYTRIQLSHARSIKTLRTTFQKEIVRAMSDFNDLAVMRIFYHKLLKNVARRQRLRQLTVVVEGMEKNLLCDMQRTFVKKWKTFWWHSIRPKLAEELLNRHKKKLMRRYFKNLAPTMIREARIARARTNLEQAHAAAKILDRTPFTTPTSIGGIKVMKSKNPFLPPLMRKGKAANPPGK